ncbi:MAG: hypothetical protein ACPIOQ_68255, partial [Promethearchaeia archaeon]
MTGPDPRGGRRRGPLASARQDGQAKGASTCGQSRCVCVARIELRPSPATLDNASNSVWAGTVKYTQTFSFYPVMRLNPCVRASGCVCVCMCVHVCVCARDRVYVCVYECIH